MQKAYMDGSVYVLQVCVCGGMYEYVLKAMEQSLHDDQRYRGREILPYPTACASDIISHHYHKPKHLTLCFIFFSSISITA